MPDLLVDRLYKGTVAADGGVTMRLDPDFARGKGDAVAVPVGAFPYKNARVVITGTMTITMYGTNGNPATAADWQIIGSALSTSGVVQDDHLWRYVKFVASSTSGGSAVVELNVSIVGGSVGITGSSAAEDSQTEADATSDVLTFAAPVAAIEIYHSEATAQDFVVNGLTLTIAAGGWRSPVGGTPSAEVTLPSGVTGVIVTRLA